MAGGNIIKEGALIGSVAASEIAERSALLSTQLPGNLWSLTKQQLKEVCACAGLSSELYSNSTKADLLSLLEGKLYESPTHDEIISEKGCPGKTKLLSDEAERKVSKSKANANTPRNKVKVTKGGSASPRAICSSKVVTKKVISTKKSRKRKRPSLKSENEDSDWEDK
jgi:hypothetical protein